MKMTSPLLLITMFLSMLCLSTCTDKVEHITKASIKTKHFKEAKPGAPITLSSSSLISLNSNTPTQVEILLDTQISQGELQVELETTAGLELMNTQSRQQLSLTHPIKIPITLIANTNGRYYLNLHLDLSTNDSRLTRNLAVIVQVGPVAEETVKFKKAAGENVISLPAKETISNK
jgi:hypothetical protein